MKKIVILFLILCLIPVNAYAAFPTEGSPWTFTREPSSDSFADGFTNNAGGETYRQATTLDIAINNGSAGRLGCWFYNQDHTSAEQTTACKVYLADVSLSNTGPSCRHNEGDLSNAVDYTVLLLYRDSDGSQKISYAQRTNGAFSEEGSSNDSWNFVTYYELKLSVSGTGASGTTMYGWLDGSPLNTASVTNVTAADDTERSCGIGGFTNAGAASVRIDDWWAEAYGEAAVGNIFMGINF
jgi:hypothetical protein